MSFARYLTAGALALIVTLGLLLLMHILIQTNLKGPEEGQSYKIPEIVMPEREIKTEFDVSKPDKPEEAEEPPPDLPDPEFDTPDIGDDAIIVGGLDPANPNIGGLAAMDGEMIPLSVPTPRYPRRASQRGTEGYCTVQFTVTAQGTTRDITVVDCPDSIFERSSVRAAAKIKFKPKVVDGNAVEVPGQQYKFTFQMAQE